MLAIHTKTGSFASGWVQYCLDHNIPFKEVDCFSNDIITDLKECRALLWHWTHNDYLAALFARQLIASVEAMGLIVFPGSSTCWHYDDKIGQKYLLEAIGAPLIPTHVFYEPQTALRWLHNTNFPVVWKLRGGAGSQNVRLIRDLKEARRIVKRSFGRGHRPSRLHALRERMWDFQRQPGLTSLVNIGRGLARTIVPHKVSRNTPPEQNYIYFQEYIPNCTFDIRVVVIGKRCYAFRRMTRGGDFRASGSGIMDHDPAMIPLSCIRIAFEVSQRIGSQSTAFDFVIAEEEAAIIEISYAFSLNGYRGCTGYWTPELEWRPGAVRPEYFMMEDVLARLKAESR